MDLIENDVEYNTKCERNNNEYKIKYNILLTGILPANTNNKDDALDLVEGILLQVLIEANKSEYIKNLFKNCSIQAETKVVDENES